MPSSNIIREYQKWVLMTIFFRLSWACANSQAAEKRPDRSFLFSALLVSSSSYIGQSSRYYRALDVNTNLVPYLDMLWIAQIRWCFRHAKQNKYSTSQWPRKWKKIGYWAQNDIKVDCTLHQNAGNCKSLHWSNLVVFQEQFPARFSPPKTMHT